MSKMTEVTASGSDIIGGMKSFLNVLTEYNIGEYMRIEERI